MTKTLMSSTPTERVALTGILAGSTGTTTSNLVPHVASPWRPLAPPQGTARGPKLPRIALPSLRPSPPLTLKLSRSSSSSSNSSSVFCFPDTSSFWLTSSLLLGGTADSRPNFKFALLSPLPLLFKVLRHNHRGLEYLCFQASILHTCMDSLSATPCTLDHASLLY